jgi:hypothetical protein
MLSPARDNKEVASFLTSQPFANGWVTVAAQSWNSRLQRFAKQCWQVTRFLERYFCNENITKYGINQLSKYLNIHHRHKTTRSLHL